MITMNKIAKILSVVLSVSLVIGVTVAMLVSAFAVTAPKFSISVAEESKDSVKLALCLESGSINSCGVYVKAADWNNPNKTTGLTIKSVERGQAFRDFATAHENDKVPPLIAINTDRGFGEASFASVAAYSEKGVMLYFTFAKGNSAKAKIEPSDIIVEFDGTVDGNNNPVTPTLDNKIPAPATTTTTTTTKKADVTTTTKKADVTTTTTKKADVTTTTKKADVTTTTKAAEDVTTTTKAAEDVTTTTKAAEDVTTTTKAADDVTSSTKSDDVVTTAPAADTTTAASSSDVVNPETGDRLTASAAVVALLAISGAAVVALRKKED
ncbi:MAG: LPXTG cell wall anchor domain-containing protein [Ruminococcaceae bacterium]|nr:LPXTG cell wall anchor domain-containing protein [Oscillospiraceae bacterium]